MDVQIYGALWSKQNMAQMTFYRLLSQMFSGTLVINLQQLVLQIA